MCSHGNESLFKCLFVLFFLLVVFKFNNNANVNFVHRRVHTIIIMGKHLRKKEIDLILDLGIFKWLLVALRAV